MFPATPQLNGTGLEADQASPLAKTRISSFGEYSPKSTAERKFPRPFGTERKLHPSRGAEHYQEQGDISKTQEPLDLVEKSNSQLLQDVTQLKRHVEDLTVRLYEANEAARRERLHAEEVEQATYLAAESWQAELQVIKQEYGAAAVELQTNNQLIESLKHELNICTKDKNEAMRLAGEAMNAAEFSSKRVGELSAELLATKESLVAVETATSRMHELMNELSSARQGLADAIASHEKIAQERATMLAANEAALKEIAKAANSAKLEIEHLKQDLALAKKTELRLGDVNLMLEKLRSDIAAAKEAEKNTFADVTYVHSDYEGVHLERETTKISESMSLSSSAAVSLELEEAQVDSVPLAVNGETSSMPLEILKTEDDLKQFNFTEMGGREASANGKELALNSELTDSMEKSKSESELLTERETRAYAAVEFLKLQSDRQRLELVILLEKESSANATIAALTTELEGNQKQLAQQQEREQRLVARASALATHLERHRVEFLEMKERESRMASNIGGLMSDRERRQLEVVRLKDKVSSVDDTETDRVKLFDLKEREAGDNAEVAALHTELIKLKQELESALTAEKVVKQEADNLRLSLQMANSEKEKARWEAQIANAEAAQNKEDAMVVLTKAQEAIDQALEAAHETELKAQARAQEAKSAKAAASEEAQMARREAEVANNKLHEASVEVEMASKELGQAREEVESVRKAVELLRTEIQVEKAAGKAAREETQVAMAVIETLEIELDKVRLDAEHARDAWKKAKIELRDAQKEIEALKLNAKNYAQTIGMADLDGMSQEHFDDLRMKQDTGDHSTAIGNKEEHLRDLEVIKVEKEASNNGNSKVHQHLADTTKSIMESEMQRLLDDSKQWTTQDAVDIPVHSKMNGYVILSEARDVKPLPDILSFRQEETEQKEDMIHKEKVAPKEEVASLPINKKKKALLLGLRNFLEKRKTPQMH